MKPSRSILYFLLLLFCVSCASKTGDRNPAPVHSKLPSLHSDKNGNVLLSWIQPKENTDSYVLKYAQRTLKSWSKPLEVASGEHWFINWADYPSVVSSNGKALAAHWLNKIPGGTYSYNVNLSMQQSSGIWSKAIVPHGDSTATEHGFVSMVPWVDDSILAIWLDGRKTENRHNAEYGNIHKAMTLRSAVVNKQGDISEQHLIDDSVCDCCNTSLALTDRGAIAVYRSRTDREIRDIYITRFEKGAWSKPIPLYRDNWNIAACPVNGPRVAVSGSTVIVAWYTAAANKRSVKAVISTDMGRSFSAPVIINEGSTLGRVDAAISENGSLFVSWMKQKSPGAANLMVTKLRPTLEGSGTVVVTEMSASRKSGFPQMETLGDHLLLAWTHFDEQNRSRIKTALLPIASSF